MMLKDNGYKYSFLQHYCENFSNYKYKYIENVPFHKSVLSSLHPEYNALNALKNPGSICVITVQRYLVMFKY